MFPDFGLAPDPVVLVHRQVQRLFPDEDADMIHRDFLPDGYNCHADGVAIVVSDDVVQVDDAAHSRELVRVSVYGPDYRQVRRLGRVLWAALTQSVTSFGLGISKSRSSFFGAGPSYKPTGFVATMSLSVGISKIFKA